MIVSCNSLTTSGKFVIDFFLYSLYNMSIKYLWFADSNQSICVSKRLKVYAFGRFFCFAYGVATHNFILDLRHKAHGQDSNCPCAFLYIRRQGVSAKNNINEVNKHDKRRIQT